MTFLELVVGVMAGNLLTVAGILFVWGGILIARDREYERRAADTVRRARPANGR